MVGNVTLNSYNSYAGEGLTTTYDFSLTEDNCATTYFNDPVCTDIFETFVEEAEAGVTGDIVACTEFTVDDPDLGEVEGIACGQISSTDDTPEISINGNNGHGNNVDGVDSSNPGQGSGGPNGGEDPSCAGEICIDDESMGGNQGLYEWLESLLASMLEYFGFSISNT